jgi:hypothetical protein
MIFLHCYHGFRLGGLRKSTEMNCKMEIIEMRGMIFRTAETFLCNLSCCDVTYRYWHMSELINRRRSRIHADCRLTVTLSQSGDRELHTFICIVAYWLKLTVWQSIDIALYVILRAHTHTHTQTRTKTQSHTRTHKRTPTHTHTHSHTVTHTHSQTHT